MRKLQSLCGMQCHQRDVVADVAVVLAFDDVEQGQRGDDVLHRFFRVVLLDALDPGQ